MDKILFVDDEKLPEWFGLPADTPHAKTALEGLRMWIDLKPDILYLDYDLGLGKGDKLLREICFHADIYKDMSKPKKVFCISINQSGGVDKIKEVCGWYYVPFEDIGQKVMFDKFTILPGQGG